MFQLDLDPIGWLASMHLLVVQNQLHRQIESLSWALVMALTAYGLLRLLYFGRGGELGYLFGRLLLALAVLLSLPLLRGVATDTWAEAYRWASGLGGPLGLLQQQQQLTQNIETLRTELPAFAASQAIMEAGGQGLNLTEAQAVTLQGLHGGATPAANLSGMATIILTVLAPLLFALYAALIFFSGFIVLLGITLLPLSGVLLMLPEGGASWLSAWIRMLSSSIFTVIFLPIAFGLVTYLGVVSPTTELASGVQNANIIMTDVVNTLAPYQDQPALPDLRALLDLGGRLAAEIQAAVQGFFVVLVNWLVSIIMMIAGFIIGIFLLFRLETVVRGFMGGVLAGAGAAAGKLSLAAWKAGRGLTAGSRASVTAGGGGGDGWRGGGGSSAKLSPPEGGGGATTRSGNWQPQGDRTATSPSMGGSVSSTRPAPGGSVSSTTPLPGDGGGKA